MPPGISVLLLITNHTQSWGALRTRRSCFGWPTSPWFNTLISFPSSGWFREEGIFPCLCGVSLTELSLSITFLKYWYTSFSINEMNLTRMIIFWLWLWWSHECSENTAHFLSLLICLQIWLFPCKGLNLGELNWNNYLCLWTPFIIGYFQNWTKEERHKPRAREWMI